MQYVLVVIGTAIFIVLFIDQLMNFMNSNTWCFMCWGSEHCQNCIFCINCDRCRYCKKCKSCTSCVRCINCKKLSKGRRVTDYGQ